jgi:hypothetical protein
VEVIRGFAGDDIEVAKFYPDDDEFLIERETVTHHFVVRGEPSLPSRVP